MPSPIDRRLFQVKSSGSWLERIGEDLLLLFTIHAGPHSSANGAPIHLLDEKPLAASRRAQSASLLLHVAIGAAIFVAVVYLQKYPAPHPWFRGPLLEFPSLARMNENRIAPGKNGGGGDNNPVPATRGNLAPLSSMQLLAPRLPDQQQHPLVVQPTLQDDRAPEQVPLVTNLGLPDGDVTNSPGPGTHGIGNRGDGGMGDHDGKGGSEGERYGLRGVTPVSCVYCPDPLYTDEARKAKLQGRVLLRVLVGVDGRAADVRIIAPLGLGLDERAVETVRAWRFVPSKDAANKPVPSWVTVETVYRLF